MRTYYALLLYAFAFCVVLGVLFWLFSTLMLLMLFSFVISTISRPIVQVFTRVRLPEVVAILLTFLLWHGVFFALISVFMPLIIEQLQLIARADYQTVVMKIAPFVEKIETFLVDRHIISSSQTNLLEIVSNYLLDLAKSLDIRDIFGQVFSFAGNFFIAYLSILFISFVFLYQEKFFIRQFFSLIPNKYFEMVSAAFYEIEYRFGHYLTGLFLQITAIFTCASVGLALAGVPYYLTIAIFAALANIVPYLGPLMGASFGILIGISTSDIAIISYATLGLLLRVVLVFAMVQLLDNTVFQPLIFSRSVKAHPLEIFIVIFASAILGGIIGMVVAIPIYTIVRVMWVEGYKSARAYHIFHA